MEAVEVAGGTPAWLGLPPLGPLGCCGPGWSAVWAVGRPLPAAAAHEVEVVTGAPPCP